MYVLVFSRIFLPFVLQVSVVVSGFSSYFCSLVLVRKLAVLIVVCLSAIGCTLRCGVSVLGEMLHPAVRQESGRACSSRSLCLLIVFVFVIMHSGLHGT